MSRKLKAVLVLGGVALAIVAYCLWPSQEPVYEGKRLRQWLDEGMRVSLYDSTTPSYSTNPSVQRVVKAVQAIDTNAIPFLLHDMVSTHDSWVEHVKVRAVRLKLMDAKHMWTYPLNRSAWGFEALGTNGAPALERLLAIYDGGSIRVASAGRALSALGPFAVPELEKRLHDADPKTRCHAASHLGLMGPVAEPAIPSLVAMLDDTNSRVRLFAVHVLGQINRQPERLAPLFRRLLDDSNYEVRIHAAEGLGRFGSSAREAIPDLVRATNDSNMYVIRAARLALRQIESGASREAEQ